MCSISNYIIKQLDISVLMNNSYNQRPLVERKPLPKSHRGTVFHGRKRIVLWFNLENVYSEFTKIIEDGVALLNRTHTTL